MAKKNTTPLSSSMLSAPTVEGFQRFKGQSILIALCGGVAAYKACDLIRELYRQGANKVQVLMTEAAEQFVTPLTLETLSQQTVLRNAFCNDENHVPIHISLVQQFDAMVIMPATVNTIAKLAQGLADDLLSTTFMTFTNKPVIIAPAMNVRMWMHPLFESNLATLQALDFVSVIPPVIGHLACGEFGEGKLASQERILKELYKQLHPHKNELLGLKALVTAGGTQVALDEVRVLGNLSSGKMGEALADELWAMGADVTLVHANTLHNEKPYACIYALTPPEMLEACQQQMPSQQVLLMAAAVSDYEPTQPVKGKMKKQNETTLSLKKGVDILETLATNKKKHQRFIGFAAESGAANTTVIMDKLKRKALDAIVYNDISRTDIALSSDDNEVTWFTTSQRLELKKAPKAIIARQLLQQVEQLLKQKQTALKA